MRELSESQRFRVVRVYFRLPPEPGGMEAHVARLSAAQRQLGVDVLNVYNTGCPNGAAVQLFSERNLLPIRPSALRDAIFFAGAIINWRRLRCTLPTVLHVHGDWSAFICSRLLARVVGAKAVVASLHDTIPRKPRLYRWALSHCDLIFSTGKRDQVWLEGVLGRSVCHLPSAPLDVFYRRHTSLKTSSCDVITVANFVPKKRLDLVLECAASCPDLEFVIYGEGPERKELSSRARKDGVTNIRFPGRLPADQIAVALKLARVFLLTSEAEGTPTAALEAMAAGLPVVLTPSNEYGWLIERGINGYVTKSWEVDELVATIRGVLADEERRVAMGSAGRTRAQEYSWRANAERVSGLMAETLDLTWKAANKK